MMAPQARKATGLRQTIEDNIIVLAVTIAVAAGGVVYGVVSYFDGQREQNMQAQFKLYGDSLINKHAEEIQKIEHDFNTKIEVLQYRLSSIERGLGDQKYFSIQTFFTPRANDKKATAISRRTTI